MFNERFHSAIAQTGLDFPDPIIADGKIHRFKIAGDNSKPCWYALHIINERVAYGAFGCFKRGISETWTNCGDIKSLSSQDQALLKQKQAELKKELQERQAKAKKRAQYIWEHSKSDFAEHPYLTRKQVKAFGLRLYKSMLLVPLYNEFGELSSLQFITAIGAKWFKKDAPTKGCFFTIGALGAKIYIAEGFATAATICQTTDCGVIVAFYAYNLLSVAQIIRKKHPDAEIIIAADNDAFTEVGNIGKEKATFATKTIKAKLAVPYFKNTETKPTDFNDLMVLEDLDEVREQLSKAIEVKENLEEAAQRLANLSPIEYEQARKAEAKALNVRVSCLDDFVTASRQPNPQTTTNPELENGIEPYPEPVDGAVIAQEIKSLLQQHVILSDTQINTIVLWVLGTYCFNAFSIFPKLLLTSPTKRCGKSTVIAILRSTVNRALTAANATPASIFRAVDLWQPSILIDEGDTFIKNNEELRGIINSGHSKETAFVLRVEGDSANRAPKCFSTWSPMTIAMIKKPPDTITDRSIVIALRRKLQNEHIEKLDNDSFTKLKSLRQKLKRWANDNLEALKTARPTMPAISNDRAADNWLPLFAIAEILGEDWLANATNALQALSAIEEEEGFATLLLSDIKDIFEQDHAEKIHADDLVTKLTALENRSWNEWRNGNPLTKTSLAKMLKPFEIKSKQIWHNGQNKYGYELKTFQDAFNRYISAIPPNQNARTLECNTGVGFGAIQNARTENSLAFQNRPQPNIGAGSSVLAFQKGGGNENNRVRLTL